jgi:hypothetical protein
MRDAQLVLGGNEAGARDVTTVLYTRKAANSHPVTGTVHKSWSDIVYSDHVKAWCHARFV